MDFNNINFGEDFQTRPIVIIDSGKGGLYTLKQLSKEFPVENFALFYDNGYAPYGDKEPKELRRHFARLGKKVKALNPKAVVIACNTLDAIAGDDFGAIFPNIPVFRVIAKTAKLAESMTKSRKVALIATPNTVHSQQYMRYMLLDNIALYALECEGLAQAIDNNAEPVKVMKTEIKPLETIDFDTLILGCTHYHYILPSIKKIYQDVNLVDSADALIEEVVNQFPKHLLNKASKQKIYIVMTKENTKIAEEILRNDLENAIIVSGV